MHRMYVALNKVTLWTGAWLYGVRQQFHMAPAIDPYNVATTSGGYSKMCCVKLVIHSESRMTRVQWVCSEVDNSAIVATVKRLGLISTRSIQQLVKKIK